MTETGTDKADELLAYIERLNRGEDLQQVQEDFRHNFGSVKAGDIVKAERTLMQRGTPVSQVQKLCDLHSALFHGDTRQERIDNAERAVQASLKKEAAHRLPQNSKEMKSAESAEIPGHPLNILTQENREFMMRLDHLDHLNEKGAGRSELLAALKDLTISGAHYDKKDELILPPLKRHGIQGPADVMWNVDSDLRKTNKILCEKLTEGEEDLNSEIRSLTKRMREMIFKEDKILYPLAEKYFRKEEWQMIDQDMNRFGYAWLKEIPVWKDAAPEQKEKTGIAGSEAAENAEIRLPGGTFSLKELEGILRALPLELTFIDAKDTNRYFSSESSLFPRAMSALGHPVYECHPPKAVPIVKHVIETLRSGDKDEISFATQKHGRKAYVRYLAVRSAEGEYLGVLEAVEDITERQ